MVMCESLKMEHMCYEGGVDDLPNKRPRRYRMTIRRCTKVRSPK
jgi:hypothetical protein